MQAGFNMPHVKTKDIKIYYEQAGRGSDVLVLGGSGADLRVKPNIMHSPLTSAFRVTSFDQRGLGQTDKPDGAYTMADYADDAAALMDALDIDHAMVLGISFGGMVGQEMAIRHGNRISRLALFCTSSGGAGGASYPLHTLAPVKQDSKTEALLDLIKLYDTRIDDEWLAANPDHMKTYQRRNDMRPFMDEPNWAQGRAAQLAARATHDCWDRLGKIACPTWLAGGSYDGIAYPDSMRALETKIPNATLTFYEGGHLFMVEDSKVFSDLITFFKKGDA